MTTPTPPRGGACAGLPPAWFFEARDDEPITTRDGRVLRAPTPPTPEDRARQRAAVTAACRSCPIRTGCLLFALEVNIESGIWAGAGEARRRALRRARAAGELAPALAAHWRLLDGVGTAADRSRLAVFGSGATHGRPGTYAKSCRCTSCSLAISIRTAGDKRRARVVPTEVAA